MTDGALAGLKVVELSRYAAAPYCGKGPMMRSAARKKSWPSNIGMRWLPICQTGSQRSKKKCRLLN